MATRIDDQFEFVAAALSSHPDTVLVSGRAIGFAEDRIYSDWAEMAQSEADRPDGIEAVSITTPNHLYIPVARAFIA